MQPVSRSIQRLVLVATLVLGPAADLDAQETFADWLTQTPTEASFVVDTINGMVVLENVVNTSASMSRIADDLHTETNFPETWFSPVTPPTGTEFIGCAINGSGSADWTILFTPPIVDPRFHFYNLDAARFDFAPTMTTGGDPVAFTRLSGNPEFEVSGTVVNSTTRNATNAGCEDVAGGNPEGGCGSLQFTGTYSTITFTAADTVAGDGFGWTVSTLPTPATPVVDVPTLGELALGLFALLLTAGAIVTLRRSAG